MFVNHTDVRMARIKVKGGLNLVYNLYEMNGWETQSDFSIGRRKSLDPFSMQISEKPVASPLDIPSRNPSRTGTSVQASLELLAAFSGHDNSRDCALFEKTKLKIKMLDFKMN